MTKDSWQKSKQSKPQQPDPMMQAQARWIYEYKHERLGKEAAEREARQRDIPEKRINAVLWYPIAGFDHEGEPCECKAQVWLNGICLGCGREKVDSGK